MPTVWKRSDKSELTNTVKQICDIQSHILFVQQSGLQEDLQILPVSVQSLSYDRGLMDDFMYIAD